MTDGSPKLARKVTKTTVREYDEHGTLTAETVTVETVRSKPDPGKIVGFSKPVEIAK